MKSTRRAVRSRSGGYRLNALRELVIVPIIYFGPPMVCTAPLLFLYWLYRPIVLTNPGLSSLKEPVTMALLLPPSQTEPRDDVETSNQAALANVTEAFDEPKPADKKPKSPPATRTSHLIVARHSLRFAGSVGPGTAHNVGAAANNPDRYTGISRSAASAYAYAPDQSGRYRW
jgi:hypothetical protein